MSMNWLNTGTPPANAQDFTTLNAADYETLWKEIQNQMRAGNTKIAIESMPIHWIIRMEPNLAGLGYDARVQWLDNGDGQPNSAFARFYFEKGNF